MSCKSGSNPRLYNLRFLSDSRRLIFHVSSRKVELLRMASTTVAMSLSSSAIPDKSMCLMLSRAASIGSHNLGTMPLKAETNDNESRLGNINGGGVKAAGREAKEG